MSGRFSQASREACITLALYLLFFVWWTLSAFGFGSDDPDSYTYVCGLPLWFFLSCVVGWPVITLVLWFVVRRYFDDVPLDGGDDG